MKTLDRGLLSVMALVVLLLLLNTWFAYQNIRQMHDEARMVDHTYNVLASLESVVSSVTDAETAQRGYLITGEPSYLEPYNRAVTAITTPLKALEELTQDNPAQHARIPALKDRIAQRLKLLESRLALRKDKGFEPARQAILEARGKAEMDELRKQVDAMAGVEQQLLEARSARSERVYKVSLLTTVIANVFALIMVLAFIFLLRRHLLARERNANTIYEQRETFRTTLASIGDAVMTTDTEGRVTYLNSVAQSLTGWTQEAAAGRPLEDIFHIVNEQTRAVAENPVTRVLREGVIVGLSNHSLLIARDGTERPIDDSAAPIRDRGEKTVGVVMVFRDVTERRQAETALQDANARLEQRVRERTAALVEANAKYQAIFDQGLFTGLMTLDGTLVEANRSSLEACGFTREQVIGKPFWDTAWWNRSAEVQDWIRTGFNQALKGRPFHGETIYFTADGSERLVDFAFMPIKDDTGKLRFVVPTGLDITERKQAEEARRAAEMLRESEQKLRQHAQELEQQLIASGRLVSLGEITASMAHEFNNPLGIAMGFAQDLLTETDPSSPQYRALQIIDEETRRCQKIIQELLQFARPSSAEFCPVDIKSVIDKTINLVANHLYKHKIAPVTFIDDPLPKLFADPQQLEQVFVNLYLNAIDAMPEGGKLKVGATKEQADGNTPTLVITVADTGFGIEESDLPKIFQPFFSAKKGRGMGLGLSISERIVKNHGGRIETESQVNRGTSFKIYLPLERETSQQVVG